MTGLLTSPLPLLAGLACGVGAAHAVRWTREHRRTPAALSDLVNWGFLVAPGVVLQKDGAFLAGWSYRGPDLLSATADELDALSAHVNDALLPFGDAWMFHVDAVRRPATAYAESHFPNAVSAVIDAERRATYATSGPQFETEYVLTATYLPSPEFYDRAAALFLTGGQPAALNWDQRLTVFHYHLGSLQLRLGNRLHLRRLDGDALLQHLHRCLTALDHPVAVPPHGAYLDTVLADQPLVGGLEPQIGDQHLRVVCVTGYPTVATPGLLDALNRLPFAYRWSSRIIPVSHPTAAKLIRRHQLNWFKKRKGASSWLRDMAAKQPTPRPQEDALFQDQHAYAMAEDAARALAMSTSGAVRYCVYNQVLVVADPDPVRATTIAGEMLKTLQDGGCTARIETVNALDAFLGTLPGHGYPNLRRPLLHTRNIADTLPVTSVWPGLSENPSPYFPPHSPPLLWGKTEGSTPFRINLHDDDVGHTLVVGRTGAGKSTLVGLTVAQFHRYPDAQIFVFDVGYSGWLLAQAAGGRHYDIAAEQAGALSFQPLANIHEHADRSWAADWLAMLLELQGVDVTPRHRVRIHRALTLVAKNDPAHRTLTEFTIHLQDPELALAFRPYTLAGAYGRLLDATHDDFDTGSYQVFELKHLMEMDDKILVPTLLYLFHRVEQQLDGRPTLIVIEELWAPLMRTVFARRITQWLVTLRKQNAAVMLVAHSPAQFEKMPTASLLIESCPTRLFLPNPDARSAQHADRYRTCGLNDREIDLIARARPKQDYYVKTPKGSRLFELGLGPVAMAFLSTPHGRTADETRAHVTALMGRVGASWPAAWLRECGLPEWATVYERYSTPRPEGPPLSAEESDALHAQ